MKVAVVGATDMADGEMCFRAGGLAGAENLERRHGLVFLTLDRAVRSGDLNRSPGHAFGL